MAVFGGAYLFSVRLIGKLQKTVVLNHSALGTHTLILQQIRLKSHHTTNKCSNLLLNSDT